MSVSEKDNDGATPLHFASARGRHTHNAKHWIVLSAAYLILICWMCCMERGGVCEQERLTAIV